MRPSAPWMKNAQKSSADIRSIRRQISRQCCGGWSRAPILDSRAEAGSQDKGVNRDKVVATPGALAALEASGESLFGVPKSPFAFNSRVHSPMLLALDRFGDVVLSQCAAACVSLYERRHSHERE